MDAHLNGGQPAPQPGPQGLQQVQVQPDPQRIIQVLMRELGQANDNRYYLMSLVEELQARHNEELRTMIEQHTAETAALREQIVKLSPVPDSPDES